MNTKRLGNTTLETAPVILGGNVFGWTIDEKTSFGVLDAFIDAGFNALDTADVYSKWYPGNNGGESETIIGKWLKKKGNREKIIIATKVGADLGNGTNLKAAYIESAVELSLQRLQTDYIDLYQSHYDDPYTDVEETMHAYDKLVKAGKVRWVGASNLSKERIEASLQASAKSDIARYETIQPLYNLYDRETFETEYKQLCLDNGISALPYFALASGFLSGKYKTEADLGQSLRGNAVKKYMTDRGFRILNALEVVAESTRATPAQVAIAWLLRQPGVSAAIASATSTLQVEDLIKAATLELSGEQLAYLTEASAS